MELWTSTHGGALLPAAVSAPKMAAGWMAAKQCDRQARALLAGN